MEHNYLLLVINKILFMMMMINYKLLNNNFNLINKIYSDILRQNNLLNIC